MSRTGKQAATHEAWHRLSVDEALARQSATSEGLSREEAAARLAQYGENRLEQAQGRPWCKRAPYLALSSDIIGTSAKS